MRSSAYKQRLADRWSDVLLERNCTFGEAIRIAKAEVDAEIALGLTTVQWLGIRDLKACYQLVRADDASLVYEFRPRDKYLWDISAFYTDFNDTTVRVGAEREQYIERYFLDEISAKVPGLLESGTRSDGSTFLFINAETAPAELLDLFDIRAEVEQELSRRQESPDLGM